MADNQTNLRPKNHSPLEWLGIQIAKREGFIARCVSRKNQKVIKKLQQELAEAHKMIRELKEQLNAPTQAKHPTTPTSQNNVDTVQKAPFDPTPISPDHTSPQTFPPLHISPNLNNPNPTTTKEDSPPPKSAPKALNFWKTWERGTPPEPKTPSQRPGGLPSPVNPQLDSPSPTQSPYTAPPPSQPPLRLTPEGPRDLRTPPPEQKPEPTIVVPAQIGHPPVGSGTIRILHQESMEITQEQYDALDELLAPRSYKKIRKKQKKK